MWCTTCPSNIVSIKILRYSLRIPKKKDSIDSAKMLRFYKLFIEFIIIVCYNMKQRCRALFYIGRN